MVVELACPIPKGGKEEQDDDMKPSSFVPSPPSPLWPKGGSRRRRRVWRGERSFRVL